MEIILRQDVERVGKAGQTLKVRDGFARNFLLPRGLAWPATPQRLRQVVAEQRVVEAQRTQERAHLEALKATLAQRSVTIRMAAGPDDKLFGSVTTTHIAEALQHDGLPIDKRKIELAQPITALGVYHVPVRLAADVTATIKAWVVKA